MKLHLTGTRSALALLPALVAGLTLTAGMTFDAGEAAARTKRCSYNDHVCRTSGYPPPIAPKPDPGGQQQQ